MIPRITNSLTRIPSLFNNVRLMSEFTGTPEQCINKVQLMGRVGTVPVVTDNERYRSISLDMATNIRYPKRNANGEVEYLTKTEWHKVKVFKANLVERVEKSVTKGTRLMVTGALEYYPRELPNGDVVMCSKIASSDIVILASPKESTFRR